jgi:hypothetical protein
MRPAMTGVPAHPGERAGAGAGWYGGRAASDAEA